MLKRLLKYDFKSVFKYWWIAAVSSLALCVIGGACINVFQIERDLPRVVNASAGLMLGISIFGLIAFLILSQILVFVRFYKNFFTDEGYLTFTLPVKRSSLLNSKLIMTVTASVATIIALAINVGAMILTGFSEKIFTKVFWDNVVTICEDIIEEFGFYLLVYAVEFIAIGILMIIFSVLFIYCCITLASIITKKARIITAIGIYYGANMVFSFVCEIFILFGARGIIDRLSEMPENSQFMMFSFVLLGIIILIAVFCSILYTLQYYMLDRKLNLA